jgi:hypothetical protein
MFAKSGALLIPPVDVVCHTVLGTYYFPEDADVEGVGDGGSSNSDQKKQSSELSVEWAPVVPDVLHIPHIVDIAVWQGYDNTVLAKVNMSADPVAGWLYCLLSRIPSTDPAFPSSTNELITLTISSTFGSTVYLPPSAVYTQYLVQFSNVRPQSEYQVDCVTQDTGAPASTAPLSSVLSHQHIVTTNGTRTVTFTCLPSHLLSSDLILPPTDTQSIANMFTFEVMVLPEEGVVIEVRPIVTQLSNQNAVVTFTPPLMSFFTYSASTKATFVAQLSPYSSVLNTADWAGVSLEVTTVHTQEPSHIFLPQYAVPAADIVLQVCIFIFNLF